VKRVFWAVAVVSLIALSVTVVSAEQNNPGNPLRNVPIKIHIGSQVYSTSTDMSGLWLNLAGLPSVENIQVDVGPITLFAGQRVKVFGGIWKNGYPGTLPPKVAELWIDNNVNGIYGDPGDTMYDRVTTNGLGDFEFKTYTVPSSPVPAIPLGVRVFVGPEPTAWELDGQMELR
jgi:hypothetical protein